MRHFDLCVSIIGGMAAALVSMDASAGGPFVDVRSVDPTITIELRYAGQNNFLGHSLYPLGTRALARPEVASALAVAQSVLRRYQYGLALLKSSRIEKGSKLGWPEFVNVVGQTEQESLFALGGE